MRLHRAVAAVSVMILGFAPLPQVAAQSAAGYWQREGAPAFNYCSGSGPRAECLDHRGGDGTRTEILDVAPDHVTTRYTNSLGNSLTYTLSWTIPERVVPGELIETSTKAAVVGISVRDPRYPVSFRTSTVQWQGFSPLYTVLAESPEVVGTAVGQTVSVGNPNVRADLNAHPPPGTPATGMLKISPVYEVGITISYAWVPGTPPRTASVPATPPQPIVPPPAPPPLPAAVEDPVANSTWQISTAPEGYFSGQWRFLSNGTVQGLVNGAVVWTGEWRRLGHYVYSYTSTYQGVTFTEWVRFADSGNAGHATTLLGYPSADMTTPHRRGTRSG